jgi:hypothetical protein
MPTWLELVLQIAGGLSLVGGIIMSLVKMFGSVKKPCKEQFKVLETDSKAHNLELCHVKEKTSGLTQEIAIVNNRLENLQIDMGDVKICIKENSKATTDAIIELAKVMTLVKK